MAENNMDCVRDEAANGEQVVAAEQQPEVSWGNDFVEMDLDLSLLSMRGEDTDGGEAAIGANDGDGIRHGFFSNECLFADIKCFDVPKKSRHNSNFLILKEICILDHEGKVLVHEIINAPQYFLRWLNNDTYLRRHASYLTRRKHGLCVNQHGISITKLLGRVQESLGREHVVMFVRGVEEAGLLGAMFEYLKVINFCEIAEGATIKTFPEECCSFHLAKTAKGAQIECAQRGAEFILKQFMNSAQH